MLLSKIDLVNRLESLRSFRDVKYIVYKEIHKHYLRKCFNRVKKDMHWSDKLGFIGYYCAHLENWQWGPLFNRRSIDLKHVKDLFRVHMRFIHKVVFRNGDVPIVNISRDEYKAHVQIPQKYLFSSIIDARVY